MRAPPCTVTLLRPAETSWLSLSEQMRKNEGGYAGDGTNVYVPAIDDWLDEYRERILACADELNIHCDLQELQLHGIPLKGRRRLQLDEAHILTTLDPTRDMCWEMRAQLRRDPDKRAVLAFSSPEYRDELLELITMTTTVLKRDWIPGPEGRVLRPSEEIRQKKLPRMFAFNYRDEEQMDTVCKRAMKYPDEEGMKTM